MPDAAPVGLILAGASLTSKKVQAIDDYKIVDSEIIKKIQLLENQKEAAVSAENYDEAKRIKTKIQRIRLLAQEYSELELQKKIAISNEDYDTAKVAKSRLDDIKLELFTNQSRTMKSVISQSSLYRVQEKSQEQEYSVQVSPPQSAVRISSPLRRSSMKRTQSYDEMVIPTMRNKAGPIDYSKVDDSKFQPSSPSFEEAEEEIPSRYKAEVEHLEHIFNPASIKKLFSKSWHSRQKAIVELSNEAKSQRGHDAFLAALHVVKIAISDKITQVSSKGVALFSQCLSSPEATKWHLSPGLLHPILVHVLQQSADNRAAVRQPAIASYKKFLDLLKKRSKAEFSEYVQFLLSDRSYLKKVLKGSFRHASVRLLLFKEVLGQSGDQHLPVNGIVDYAIDALTYPNADVRHQAMEVIKAAYRRVGFSRLEKQLSFIPPNLREPLSSSIPEIREMLGVEKAQKGLQQAMSPKKPGNAKEAKKQGSCQFCGKKSKEFRPNLDYTDSTSTILDLHFLQECKMLMQCPGCQQIIQISTLNRHLLRECANSILWSQCKRCSEAIPKQELDSHSRANICEPGKNPSTANRCPLCHMDIPPYDKGWRQHLLVEFCPKNSR